MNLAYRIARKLKRHSQSVMRLFHTKEEIANTKVADITVSGRQIIQRLPGFVYGNFRNIAPYVFNINSAVSRIRLSLIDENPEVLNFNHIAFWVDKGNGEYEKYDGKYTCTMSSVAEVLPDPAAAMRGDGSNSVSVHSKRELKPWWQVEFDRPVHVAYVLFYNRKDLWGIRSKSLLLSAFDNNHKKVLEASRVTSKGANQQLNEQFTDLVDPTFHLLENDTETRTLANQVKKSVYHWISAQHQPSPEFKSELLNQLSQLHTLTRKPTSDLPTRKECADFFELPCDATELRVIGFRKKVNRQVILKAVINGDERVLNHQTLVPNQKVKRLKSAIWTLQSAHCFHLPLTENVAVHKVGLFCDDFHSQDVFVQRLIEYKDSSGQWQLVHTTLENLQVRLGLLTIHEWLIGKQWDQAFVSHLSHMLATYRMSQARTVKPLLAKNRKLLPYFYEGIQQGGCTASYIPAVSYTRHGLAVPFSELDSSFLAGRMHSFVHYLKENYGFDAFPCYGTLLGIVRDGDFLPHDDDIDLAVVVDLPEGMNYREATEMWAEKLKDDGLECKPPTPKSLNLHCYFEGFDMDLFLIYRIPGEPTKVMTHMEGYKVRKVKSKLLEPLKAIEFEGYTFKIPKNVEGFLADRYGKNWTIPDPTFEL